MKSCATIICYTPLHVLIAEKVIEKEKIRDFILIYIAENKSQKNLHYFNMLEKKAVTALYFIRKNSAFDFLRIISPLTALRRSTSGGSVYAGNIKTLYSRFIIWFLKCDSSINTFDDGLGNIYNKDSYFLKKSESAPARIFFSLVDPSYLYKNLVSRIQNHFTIYKHRNVFPDCTYIDLFPEHVVKTESGKNLNILIASALALEKDLTVEEENQFYDALLQRYQIDLIIRHPRNEIYQPSYPCQVSDSLLIAEHQILELAKAYTLFVVSPVYSSVLINIPDQIRKLNVIPSNGKKLYPEIRKFYDSLGIETVTIEMENDIHHHGVKIES